MFVVWRTSLLFRIDIYSYSPRIINFTEFYSKFISSSPSPSRSVLSSILPCQCRGLSLLSSFGYLPLYKVFVICLDNSRDDGPLFFWIAYTMMFYYLFCYLIRSCSIIFTCFCQWLAMDWPVRGSNPGGCEFLHTSPDGLWGPPGLSRGLSGRCVALSAEVKG